MATVKCYADESVTLARSNEDNLKVSPNFLPGETYLIFEQEQARKLYTEIGKMMAELWPDKEPEGTDRAGPYLSLTDRDGDKLGLNLHLTGGSAYLHTGNTGFYLSSDHAQQLYDALWRKLKANTVSAEVVKPPSLSIKDEEDDKIEVGLGTRGGSLVVEVGITEAGNEDETYAVWLTEAQTEELIKSLEAHKSFVAQENAKPKPVSSTIFDFPMPSGYGAIDWGVSPIGYGVVSRGTIKIPSPDEAPEPKAKTYTITINLKE